MKITLLTSSLSGGGAERVVANLANYLASKGHDVDVLTVSDEKTYAIDDKVNHVCMNGRFGAKLPHSLKNLVRLFNFNWYLRSRKRDIILSFLPRLTVFLMKQSRFIKCPVILAERCDPGQYGDSFKPKILEAYSKGNGFVFQTEDARQFYVDNGLDMSNSVVIPNAINTAFIRPAFEGVRRKAILGMGRLNEQKNFPLLIEAFSKIKDKHPDYKLEIFGQGSLLDDLKALANQKGVADRVEFKGYVSNVPEAIEGASLFVLSSDFEGMPNALAEAMALGLPCVSTDCPVGGPKFLINDGENGLLVPVGDVDALADAMDYMLSNPDKAAKMGENARKLADELTPDRIYGEWERFIIKTADEVRK